MQPERFFWNGIAKSRNGKTKERENLCFKDDLLAKVFGGFVHQQMEENNIARLLYNKALDVLF